MKVVPKEAQKRRAAIIRRSVSTPSTGIDENQFRTSAGRGALRRRKAPRGKQEALLMRDRGAGTGTGTGTRAGARAGALVAIGTGGCANVLFGSKLVEARSTLVGLAAWAGRGWASWGDRTTGIGSTVWLMHSNLQV